MTTPFPPVPGADQNKNLLIYPTGDPTGAGDAARINQAVSKLPSTGGSIILAAGNWYLKPGTVTILVGDSQTITVSGPGAIINTVAGAAGDVIRMYDPNAWSGGSDRIGQRSGIKDLIIDGTNAAAGVTGLHFGDIAAPQLNVTIQNFTGAGSIGLNLDNAVNWTEEGDIRAVVWNCTTHVQVIVTTGAPSFAYGNYDFTIVAGSNQQNGVAILNGAFFYHSRLRIRGNMQGGASATTACALRMAGINSSGGPSNGRTVVFADNELIVQMECTSGANNPRTIIMDTVNFAFASGNYGLLSWAVPGSAPGFSAGQFNPGQFVFTGEINGDPTVAANDNTYGSWQFAGQPVIYSYNASSSGNIKVGDVYDMTSLTLTGNTTIALNVGNPTPAVPQRVTIVITQAAGGGFTVTWPHAASPTNASPRVVWAGGAAPVMTAAANAVDVYDLETFNGAVWYGRATQNVS